MFGGKTLISQPMPAFVAKDSEKKNEYTQIEKRLQVIYRNKATLDREIANLFIRYNELFDNYKISQNLHRDPYRTTLSLRSAANEKLEKVLAEERLKRNLPELTIPEMLGLILNDVKTSLEYKAKLTDCDNLLKESCELSKRQKELCDPKSVASSTGTYISPPEFKKRT